MIDLPYVRGLHDLGSGTYAWTEPDGSWGFSNAGLVTGDGASLLVDTLFDVPMTRAMLEGMTPVTAAHPITTVVNTHCNGDHWFGNQLLAGTEIISTRACAEEMPASGPGPLIGARQAPGPVGDFARAIFGAFDWSDVVPTYPTRTFEGRLTLDIGGTTVDLLQLGPAHTEGDAVVHVPAAGVLYAGDLLFIGGTPIAWAGPIQNWIDACDLMISLDAEIIVPGHGPVTDNDGVRAVQHYLQYVKDQATEKFKAGIPPLEAARQIPLEEFAGWNERGRIVQNVLSVYYGLDPTLAPVDVATVLAHIAELD